MPPVGRASVPASRVYRKVSLRLTAVPHGHQNNSATRSFSHATRRRLFDEGFDLISGALIYHERRIYISLIKNFKDLIVGHGIK